jgi:hypothetical protein
MQNNLQDNNTNKVTISSKICGTYVKQEYAKYEGTNYAENYAKKRGKICNKYMHNMR